MRETRYFQADLIDFGRQAPCQQAMSCASLRQDVASQGAGKGLKWTKGDSTGYDQILLEDPSDLRRPKSAPSILFF